ncbi:histidine kinase N-terminal 7TM domain-containing diguanylate cyclase [Anaerotignum sp.]|uniref:histidine kinase N-terminal 7TM domain-containing diguanylate cyclase n=1 Tax=Anaerotignum sp. TaxID=2039241 RepID=UPI002714ECBA|nr:diguanylate cyclase [Anaerotignum sp.]
MNVVSLIIISLLGMLSFKNRDEQCSKYFTYSMIFMIIWTLGTVFELSTHNFYLKVFFRNVVQFGMAFVSISDYWFVVSYTKSENSVHRAILCIFIILNILSMILLFTDPIHNLMRSKIYMLESNGDFDLIVTSTYLGAFFVQIRFILFGFATVLLFIHLAKIFRNMRKQVIMISMGCLLALVLLVAQQYWLQDHGFSVPMSVIMCIPYIFISIGVFKYDFLSVSPLAKDWVINSLEEGIVVLSKEGKILEANTAASIFLDDFGYMLDKNALYNIYNRVEDSVHQLKLETASGIYYYEVKIHHFLMKNGKRGGGVAVIRNITEQMVRQHELQEKAELDGLTQIYNRKTLEREYGALKNGSTSIMIIDIDKFKQINDTFGHPTGDAVILGVVEAMKKCIGNTDLIGRLGGDEFCIILKEGSTERCQDISNQIFEKIKFQRYEVACKLPNIQVSIGAATNLEVETIPFEDAYKKADDMLYTAKQKGGNCCVIQ